MSGMATKHGKRVYQKPAIEQVRLIAEEAVLTACKTTDGYFDNWGSGNCGIVFQCREIGS